MPRYIDADALIPIMEEMIWSGDYCKDCIKDAIYEVETAPTVSPDEVRGVGRWLHTSDEFGTYEKCSCCGKEYYCGPIAPFNYCPACGARMKGGAD